MVGIGLGRVLLANGESHSDMLMMRCKMCSKDMGSVLASPRLL